MQNSGDLSLMNRTGQLKNKREREVRIFFYILIPSCNSNNSVFILWTLLFYFIIANLSSLGKTLAPKFNLR